MDFEYEFPLRFLVNLGRREDRRAEAEWRFANAGLSVERWPAIDARFVENMSLYKNKGKNFFAALGANEERIDYRGYESFGRYALALTQRIAIREAKKRKAKSVLLFEDDVILHPNFSAIVNRIELPDDWGIFYFGCAYTGEMPEPHSPGIVKVGWAVDTHAIAINARYFDAVLRALDGHRSTRPLHPLASDQYIAALQGTIPSYACFPNLAWQSDAYSSDLLGWNYTNYRSSGTSKHRPSEVNALFREMYGGGDSGVEKNVKLGLLFLTRGDVNQPDIWRQFAAQDPESLKVFCHPKYPEQVDGGFLDGTVVDDLYETKWGSVSLVQATRSLLRAALRDNTITHFVLLSESCIPIQPLKWMLARLKANPRSRFGFQPGDNVSALRRHRSSAVPEIPEDCWRFQSQWWLLDRGAATWVMQADYTEIFSKMVVSDEAYFATVLKLSGFPLEDMVFNSDITWTEWKQGAGSPTLFEKMEDDSISKMIESGAWFARKFSSESDIGKLKLHLTQ